MLGKTAPAEGCFVQAVLLNHGSHGTVEDEQAVVFLQRTDTDRLGCFFFLQRTTGLKDYFFFLLNILDDVLHLAVGGIALVFLDDAQGLFHLLFVVEVHFYVYAVAADVVEQGTQFVQGHPAGHDALACGEDVAVEVVPLGTAALRFADARCPLDGVQLVNFQ